MLCLQFIFVVSLGNISSQLKLTFKAHQVLKCILEIWIVPLFNAGVFLSLYPPPRPVICYYPMDVHPWKNTFEQIKLSSDKALRSSEPCDWLTLLRKRSNPCVNQTAVS